MHCPGEHQVRLPMTGCLMFYVLCFGSADWEVKMCCGVCALSQVHCMLKRHAYSVPGKLQFDRELHRVGLLLSETGLLAPSSA